jgi:hypothetical protein
MLRFSGDNRSFLLDNLEPVKQMLALLRQHFKPTDNNDNDDNNASGDFYCRLSLLSLTFFSAKTGDNDENQQKFSLAISDGDGRL